MSPDDFWLAFIPPAMAMIVEKFSPISESVLRHDAAIDFRPFQQGANHHILLDTAVRFSESAVEISGLAPTLIACTTSGFAILREFPNPFWPSIIYVLVFMTATLVLLRLVSGKTFNELHIEAITIGTWRLPWNATRLVTASIYAANALLIALDGFAFYRFGHAASAGH